MDTQADLEARLLQGSELPAAVALLSLGMRDNPLHVRVFGGNAGARQERMRPLMAALIGLVQRRGEVRTLWQEDELVALLGLLPPGRCRAGLAERLRIAARVGLGSPPAVSWAAQRWLRHWQRRDPDTPHWHVGPLVVHPDRRRRGLASRLTGAAVEQMDEGGQGAWLETDRPENVRFYTRFGFEVRFHEPVLGVPTWFMWRPSKAQAG